MATTGQLLRWAGETLPALRRRVDDTDVAIRLSRARLSRDGRGAASDDRHPAP